MKIVIKANTDGPIVKTVIGAQGTECLTDAASIILDSAMEDKQVTMRSDLEVMSETKVVEHE